MLIIFFLSFVKSINHFDLIEPFRWSSPYLINNWELYGITNLRESLKLDQDQARNLSVICNPIPFNNSNFDIVFQLSIVSGSLYFVFSSEDCPVNYFRNMNKYYIFDGFAIKCSKSNTTNFEIDFNIFNQSNVEVLNSIKIGEFAENDEGDEQNSIKKNAISLRVQKKLNQLSISVYDSRSDQKKWKVVKTINEKITDFGYFSFFGIPSTNNGDQILYSFKVNLPSEYQQNYSNSTINKNLKIFKSKLGLYYAKKKKLNYSSQISINDTLQDQNRNKIDIETTKTIFHILSEITERAKLGLNDTEFDTLLELSAIMKLSRSEKKISKRRAVLDEIENYIDDIKTSLLHNLTNLTKTVSDEMNNIEETGFEMLKSFMPKLWEGSIVVNEVIKIKKESKKEFPLNLVLLIISLIETALFVIFFIYKRHKTKNFRKID